jgi:outer membrane receptor for ferrienterochelin and colicins
MWIVRLAIPAVVCLCLAPLYAQDRRTSGPPVRDLADLDLEQLMEIKVDGASLHPQNLGDAPASVTIITQDDIRKYGYRTLAEALSDARGFFTTYDHTYHYQGVRGFALPGDYGSRLLLMVNGHNMTDNILDQSVWFGQDFPLDMSLVKRIEVIRGPSSALYGSNGIFATINVVTFSPEEFSGTQVRTELGSLGEKKIQAASSLTLGHGAKLLLSASLLNIRGEHSIYVPAFDSPATNNGLAIDMAGENGYHLFGNLTWRDWSVTALFGGRRTTQVVSWGATTFNDPGTRVLDTPNFVDATYTHNFDSSRSLQWRTYFDSYRFQGDFRYPLDNGYSSQGSRQQFSGDWAGSQLSYRFATSHFGSFTVGATGQFDIRALQESFDVAPVHQQLLSINKLDRSFAIFAQDEFDLARDWKLDLGARFDYSLYRRKFVAPRVALIYQPSPRVSYKMLYGRAFRNPTAFELFYSDEEAQTIANPNLRPEGGNTFEFVVEGKLNPRFNALISAYRYEIHDLIVGNYTSDEDFQYQNSDTVRASGVEMELNGHPTRWLDFVASLAIQRAVNSRSDYPLPNSPGQLGNIRLAVPLFTQRVSLAGSLHYMGSRQTLAGATLPVLFLPDIVISSNHLTSNLDFQAGVRNVSNAEHLNPLGLNNQVDTLRAPGRTFFVTLSWRSPN